MATIFLLQKPIILSVLNILRQRKTKFLLRGVESFLKIQYFLF
jgi:hypothetical protein